MDGEGRTSAAYCRCDWWMVTTLEVKAWAPWPQAPMIGMLMDDQLKHRMVHKARLFGNDLSGGVPRRVVVRAVGEAGLAALAVARCAAAAAADPLKHQMAEAERQRLG